MPPQTPADAVPAARSTPAALPMSSLTPYGIAHSLARAKQPTLLYRAVSHTVLRLGGWFPAPTLLMPCTFNWLEVASGMRLPVFPYEVGVQAVILVSAAALVAYPMLSTKDLVHEIYALPTPRSPARAGAPATVLQLRIAIRPFLPLPFVRDTIMVVPLEQVSLSRGMTAPTIAMKGRPILIGERLDGVTPWPRLRDRPILELPWWVMRGIGRRIAAVGRAFMRCLYRYGFVELQVANRPYRVDVLGGWALERGLVFDKLVKAQLTAENAKLNLGR